jgi:phosphocarrier protein HPr
MLLEKDFTVTNKNGMHARPAAQFVKLASQFQSEVMVEKDEEEVNGKSIMGLMMLAAGKGEIIKITTQGIDSDKAMEAIGALITSGFGEGD